MENPYVTEEEHPNAAETFMVHDTVWDSSHTD